MNMHKILTRFALATACLAMATSCDTNDYESTESGVQYKYIEKGEGEQPSQGKVIVMKFEYATSDGKTFFDSKELENGNTTMVYDTTMMGQKGSIEEVISMLQVGDSVEAKVNADTFFKKTFNQEALPDSITKEESITFHIRLVEVADSEEYFGRKAREQAEVDNKAIEEYISNNDIKDVQKADSGLRYMITKEGEGKKIEAGDSVKIDYIGYLLDGTIFDSSIEEKAREGDVYMEGRNYAPLDLIYGRTNFIAGWNEGIGYLSKGDEATLIIPSGMAYGPQARSKQIGPNSVLIFELFVREVKENNNGAN